MISFLSNYYVQLWAIIGVSIYLLPFVLSWGVPKSLKSRSKAWLYLLMPIAVLILWPISVGGFFITLFKLVRAYFAQRARINRVIERIREDELYGEIKHAIDAARGPSLKDVLKDAILKAQAERAAREKPEAERTVAHHSV